METNVINRCLGGQHHCDDLIHTLITLPLIEGFNFLSHLGLETWPHYEETSKHAHMLRFDEAIAVCHPLLDSLDAIGLEVFFTNSFP